jgi:hypothetical protein
LIIYQGSTTTEDSLLNFSGFLALIVGLVPTDREALHGPGLPKEFDPTTFVENNVGALLIASLAAVAMYLIIQFVRNRLATPPQAELCSGADYLPKSDAPELPAVLAAVVRFLRKVLPAVAPLLRLAGRLLPCLLLGAIVAGAVVFFVDLPVFVRNAHTVAAYAMFGGIIVVAVHYGYAALRGDRGPRARIGSVAGYLIIALLMLLTLIVVAILQCTGNGLGLLIVEFIVIGEFAAFWLFQSVDLWELEKYQVPSLSEVLTQLGTNE